MTSYPGLGTRRTEEYQLLFMRG